MRWYSSPELFQKDWFSDLSLKHKVFWHFINTHCNVAGIWEPNFKTASAIIGEKFSDSDLKAFGPRIRRLQSGKILILGYATDQWGDLGSNNGVQKKVLDLLKAEGLNINDLTLVPPGGIFENQSPPRERVREREGVQVQEEDKESEEKEEMKPPPRETTPKSLEDVRVLCREVGLPDSDADWFFFKGEGNGWTNGGKPMRDWKATVRSWNAAKYFPSQKQNGGTNGISRPDYAKRVDRNKGTFNEGKAHLYANAAIKAGSIPNPSRSEPGNNEVRSPDIPR